MLKKTITVLAAVAAGLVPTASFASTAHHRDARHDVVGGAGVARPHNATADLTRVSVRHRPHRVQIVAHVREVRRHGTLLLVARITTPQGAFVAQSVRWEDEAPFAFVVDAEDADVDCAGLRSRFAASRDVLRLSVPRRCLDHPSWVRVGVGLVAMRDIDHGVVDDGLSRQPADLTDLTRTRRLVWG